MRLLLTLLLPLVAQAQMLDGDALPAITGGAPAAHFGRDVASGELDSIPGTDVVVGSTGLGVHVFRNAWDNDWGQEDLVVPDGPTTSWLRIEGPEDAWFGARVLVGDVDGDGQDDLVVGAPYEDVLIPPAQNPAALVGRVYVFLGPLDAPSLSHEDADVVIDGDRVAGAFGGGLLLVDFDHDGDDDLLVGQPAWSSIFIFVGTLEGAIHAFDTTDAAAMTTADAFRSIRGDSAGAAMGLYMGVGWLGLEGPDLPTVLVNHYPDTLLLGSEAADASTEDLPIDASEGLLGRLVNLPLPVASPPERHPLAGLWVPELVAELDDPGALLHFLPGTTWADGPTSADASFRLPGGEGDGHLGHRAVFGDVDGDGVEDLIASSPGAADPDPAPFDPTAVGPRAGAVRVFDGCHLLDPSAADPCDEAPAGEATVEPWASLTRRELGAAIEDQEDLHPQSVFVVDGRVLVGAPHHDHPAYGADAGRLQVLHLDADGDGFRLFEDCDDGDAAVHPGAEELCDGVQQDCDVLLPLSHLDSDGDGHRGCDGDCDDGDPTSHPDASEQTCDGADNDCDGTLHPAEADADADGHSLCDGDCDDVVANIHPSADELCDGADNDCDGAIDEGFDADGDGFPSAEDCSAGRPELGLDCDDDDPTVHPGATEGPTGEQDCTPDAGWPGGIACSSAGRGGFLLVLLVLFARRKSPHVALAILPLTELPIVATGSPDLALPVAITTLDTPTGPALVVGDPVADLAESNNGAVLWLEADVGLPSHIDGGDMICGGDQLNLAAGTSLASGDLNDDGVDDLLVGALGKSQILAIPGGELPVPPTSFCSSFAVLSSGVALFNSVGENVAAADLDDDGYDDVLAGDRLQGAFGGVRIWYGGEDVFDVPPDEGNLIGTDPLFDVSFAVGAFAAAVDWNCDGLLDIATGGSETNLQVALNTGGRPWTDYLVGDDSVLTYRGDFTSTLTQVRQLPDVTGNGCQDILLGVPAWGLANEGAVVIVEGSAAPSTDVDLDEAAWWMVEGEEEGDFFGAALAWIERGGAPDLVVGAPGVTVEQGVATGAVYVYSSVTWPPTEAFVARGWQHSDVLGARLISWMDLDEDGVDDVIIGAPGARPLTVDDSASPWPGALFAIESTMLDDEDGDGDVAAVDCDDEDPDVGPSALEVCGGGDEDCDGEVDEAGAEGESSWYVDEDGDGVGDPSSESESCGGDDLVSEGTDCDDLDPSVHPGAEEGCDGRDTDCDGSLAEDEVDVDLDGFFACEDCDDERDDAFPGGIETCDGADEDCDGAADEDFDLDGDGVPSGEGCAEPLDCDDGNPTVHPGAEERAGNGLDDDCLDGDAAAPLADCTCSAGGSSPSLALLALLAVRRRRR